MYGQLQKGIIPDLGMKKSSHHGNLTVLLGYGPKFFEINGLRKRKPAQLNEERLFEDLNWEAILYCLVSASNTLRT